MKTIVIPAAALALCFINALPAADDDGFVPMFNGKDLSGWVPVNLAPDTFSVRDGMIVISGVPTGYMRTEKMYENFIMECDWQHMKEGGNSGVFIWGDGIPAMGTGYTRGIEVQVLDLGYDISTRARRMVHHPWRHLPDLGRDDDAWGRIANGGKGKRSFPSERPREAVARVESLPHRVQQGRDPALGERQGGHRGQRLRAAQRLPLPGERGQRGAISRMSASRNCPRRTQRRSRPRIRYEGFKAALQRQGPHRLEGHRGQQGQSGAPTGSTSSPKAGVKGAKLDLWTDKSYKDFTLVADWKFRTKPVKKMVNKIAPNGEEPVLGADGKPEQIEVEEPADSGIYLRGSSKAQVNIWVRPIGSGDIRGYRVDKTLPMDIRTACTPKVNADAKPGQWNRFVITMKGDRCTVVLNEQTIIDNAQLPGVAAEGPIALQYHHDEIEFANVFIKEL